MEWVDEKTIRLDRELSDLDKLVLKFVNVLKKHTDYAIVSGYVAILLGRSRGTEDVDLFIPKLTKDKFVGLYADLLDNGFWSIIADSEDELYSMLEEGLAIRLAERGKVIPNMEVKFVKDRLDEFSLREKTRVMVEGGEIIISSIELQIAYKRFVLKSEKDLEDARHLQKLLDIDEEKIKKYQVLLREYGRLQ